MMNSMRSFAGGFISKLLMIFLIITFGVWGIGDMFRDSGAGYAARVGSETISVGEFSRQKAQVQRSAEAMGIKDMGGSALDINILRQLIQQRLVNLAMKDFGLYTNTTLLAKILREDPGFKNEDGSFNKEAYLTLLKTQRINEADILNQIRDQLNSSFLGGSIDVSDIAYPAAMRTLEATSALETRDAWVVTIAAANAPTIINEEALMAFYEQNKSVLYGKPELRTLEYAVLRQAKLDSTSSRTMQNALEDSLASGAKLPEALAAANINSSIQTLTDVREDGTKTAADDTVKTVIEQGFRMTEGETSGLITTPKGVPLFVHVKSLKPAGAQEYKAVSRDVHDRVAEQIRRDAARARVQEVKEAVSKVTSEDKTPTEAEIQAALAPFGLKARKVSALSRPQPRSTPSREIPPMLLQAIFERSPGSVAGPLTLASGSQMLAIVSDIHYPDAATVESHAKNISPQERQSLAEQLKQSVLARSFASFAAKHTVRINSKLLTQNAANPDDTASD